MAKPKRLGVIDTAPASMKNRAFVSSRKAEYPIYWHDQNWQEDYAMDGDYYKGDDHYADQGTLVRLPCVVRMFAFDGFLSRAVDFFNVGKTIADHCNNIRDEFGRRIWGHVTTGDSVATSNVSDPLIENAWILSCMPLTKPANETMGGKILYICFVSASTAYDPVLGFGGGPALAAEHFERWLEYEARSEKAFIWFVKIKNIAFQGEEADQHAAILAVQAVMGNQYSAYTRVEGADIASAFNYNSFIDQYFNVQ